MSARTNSFATTAGTAAPAHHRRRCHLAGLLIFLPKHLPAASPEATAGLNEPSKMQAAITATLHAYIGCGGE